MKKFFCCLTKGFQLVLLFAPLLSRADGPSITSIEPKTAAVGALLTVHGAQFSTVPTENIVRLGAVRAEVFDATSTRLTVRVPVGATYGPISVTRNGLTGSSPEAFVPTFVPGSALDNSSLGPRQDLGVNDGPTQTRVGDLDGDGRADIIAYNTYVGSVSLFRSIATPGTLNDTSFEGRVELESNGGGDAYGCIVSDLDGDGKLEVIVVDQPRDRLAIYHNQATPGTLNAASFAAAVYLATPNPQHVYAADLDGDGRLDLLACHPDRESVSILRNVTQPGVLTSGSFLSPVELVTGTGAFDLAIADLNLDGKLDLVVAARNSEALLLFENRSTVGSLDANSFEARGSLPASGLQLSAVAADLDGDGKPDLISGGYNGTVSVFRNQTTPGMLSPAAFAEHVDFATPGWTQGLAVGDLSGDGKPDVIAAGQVGDFLAIFENLSGPGDFTASSLGTGFTYATGWNAIGPSVGDLDGDGKSDVIFANIYDDVVTLYRNQIRGCLPIPSGAVAFWQAEGNAQDSLGANHGVLQGGLSFAPGFSGQAFLFDSDDDFVQVPASSSLDVGQGSGITIECWTAFTTPESRPLIEWGDNSVGVHIWFDAPGTLFANIVDTGGADHFVLARMQTLELGVFHHVALTYEKESGVAKFFHNGTSVVEVALGTFIPQTSYPLNIGKRTAPVTGQGVSFRGLIDELAVYNRALTPAELESIYSAGQLGKCGLPTIVVQPSDQTVEEGADVTFAVSVSGTGLLTYQWQHGDQDIPGATSASLLLTDVQFSDAGVYSVIVTDAVGSIRSANALLTITEPRAEVRIQNTTQTSGLAVSVPVLLDSGGTANSLSFSLNFDPQHLAFDTVTLGSDAALAVVFVNTSQVRSGTLGVALAMPPGSTFSAGSSQVLEIHFNTTQNLATRSITLSFSDYPLARQVANANVQFILSEFVDGFVQLLPSAAEADSAPRPSGDGALNILDWAQVGRFAAGMDTITAEEFQRADCAPRATLGDGQLDVMDWVQAGRYVAVLDPITMAGGPAFPAPATAASAEASSGLRQVRMARSEALANGLIALTIVLEASGDENALGFALSYDAGALFL